MEINTRHFEVPLLRESFPCTECVPLNSNGTTCHETEDNNKTLKPLSLPNIPEMLANCLYSAFTDKIERNCHFQVPGWNCMTHRQALQGFPETSQVLLHKNNKIN
jgi:hypothetical protein